MDHHEQFAAALSGPKPMLALAPMQDVTDLPFWKLMTACGGADVYKTIGTVFRAGKIEIPFPQRKVRLLNQV